DLVVRWDAQGKAAEIRGRMVEGPAGAGKGLSQFLQTLKTKGGAAAILPSAKNPWPDLPPRKAGQVFCWRDDTTCWRTTFDSSGLELSVRDCPVEESAGVPLPPLVCVPRGPDKCHL